MQLYPRGPQRLEVSQGLDNPINSEQLVIYLSFVLGNLHGFCRSVVACYPGTNTVVKMVYYLAPGLALAVAYAELEFLRRRKNKRRREDLNRRGMQKIQLFDFEKT